MATISDEIRELAGEAGIYSNACGKLRELADRIDREMVELPKDRDGVPIRVGDTVYLDDGRAAGVAHIFFMPNKAYAMCWDGDRYTERQPSDITHTRHDSLGRIADELDEQAGGITKDGYTWQEDALHDFAKRIRKLAKEDK